MFKSIIIAGDLNSLGGLTSPSFLNKKVFISNIPITVNGDSVSPHGTPPLPGVTVSSPSTKIFIGGIPIILEGDSDLPYGAKRLKSGVNIKVFSL